MDLEAEQDDVLILTRAWINERTSPELLPYQGVAIENLMELVDFQTQNTSDDPITRQIVQRDLDRIKYLVRSYLRTRLYKLEQHPKHYHQDTTRLGQNELEYLAGYVKLEDSHVKRSFVDQLPPHLRGLEEPEMISRPNLDQAVFCRVLGEVGEFQFERGEDAIVMREGNIFITRYSIVKDLLEDGKVELL